MFTHKPYLQSSSISTQLSLSNAPLHGRYVKIISQFIVAGVIATAAILPITSHAQAIVGSNDLVESHDKMQPMETISIIHRSAFDYALYEQTTEMLTYFNRELTQKIIVQARLDNLTMAKEFGFFTNQSNELAQLDKYPENIGVLEISE